MSYIGHRLLSDMGLGKEIRWMVIALLAATALLLPFPLFLVISGINPPFEEKAALLSYILLAFLSFMLAFLVIKDVLSLLFTLGNRGLEYVLGNSFAWDETRRIFLIRVLNGFLVMLSGGLLGYGLYQATNIKVKKVQVPADQLKGRLKNLKIIQITDVHVGLSIKKGFIEELVGAINTLNPDLIFFTGDAVDGPVEKLREDFAPFKELRASIGKFFVTGNHEYYAGVEDWIKEITKVGFKVLVNQNEIVSFNGEKILIAGVPDYTATRFYPNHPHIPAQAKKTSQSYSYSILLAHQPISVFEASKESYNLQLSGHTHGGQFFPWNFFVKLQQPYVAGLHKHGPTWIYVSKGTGYWGPPVRVGAQAEISQIQIG